MASSEVNERRRRLVNRVGRHLPCNTMHVVNDFAHVANKVLDNILQKPEEVKFRELRANNKTINRAIIGCHGGREFMHLLGFEKIRKHGEVFYFLAEPELVHLSQAKEWLGERVRACGATDGASAGHACADSVLTILLTSGQTLEGGFYAHETVQDVYDFLQASVVNGGEELRLRVNRTPPVDLGENMLAVSLANASLVPKATLGVVKPNAARPPAEASKRTGVDEAEALRRVQECSARRNKNAVAEKVKSEVMAKFKADHAPRADSEVDDDGGVEETKGGRR